MHAAAKGHTEIVQDLVAAGANPDTLMPEHRVQFAQAIEDGLRTRRERAGDAAAGTQ